MKKKLKYNEIAMLKVLRKLADKHGNPFIVSAPAIPVLFGQTRVLRTMVRFSPTRQGKLKILKKLQDKGIIKFDTSNRREPKITIKRGGVIE